MQGHIACVVFQTGCKPQTLSPYFLRWLWHRLRNPVRSVDLDNRPIPNPEEE